MAASRGAALLNAVLIITTFALLTGLMANFLLVGFQGMGVQAQASQAYYLAVSGASCVDGQVCNTPGAVITFGDVGNVGDVGQVTLESLVRVTAKVGDGKRILEKTGPFWREVAN